MTTSLRAALAAFAMLPTVSTIALADDKGLVPPPGYFEPAGASGKSKGGAYICPEIPTPYTESLDFPSKYEGSGKSRDTLNEQADAEYKEKTTPINDFEKGVAKIVGAYMETGKPDALACALQWYDKWASAKALLGDAPNHTGRSVRKWTLASASGAWVKLKFSASKPLASQADEEKKVEDWLSQIGDKVKDEWDPNADAHILNNHFYWAAWAEMSTAVATNRRDLFDASVKIYNRFASQADRDGYLPNELNRKTRALGYHIFAVTPLSMIAAFAQANGVDLASKGDHALKRVAERTLQGFDNPKMFEDKAGAKQVLEGFDEQSSKLAWLEPYCSVEKCTGNAAQKLDQSRPFKNTRLGGDVTSVFSASRS